jgi:predicted DNA-binding transcriptional regulator YafY
MYGGETVSVTLLCENDMAGAIIDRFGKDIPLIQIDEAHFHAHVQVAASKQFLGWVFALGKGVKIIGPESIVEAMKEETRRLAEQYL